MSATIYLYAERKTPKGWEPAHQGSDRRARELYSLYSPAVVFLLTGHKFLRLNTKELPPPIVRRPRGLPNDLSPAVSAEHRPEDAGAQSWLTPAEILTWDWHPALELIPWLADFIDAVAALEPPAEHRIVVWLER